MGPCSAGYYCVGGATEARPTDGETGSLCPPGTYCGKPCFTALGLLYHWLANKVFKPINSHIEEPLVRETVHWVHRCLTQCLILIPIIEFSKTISSGIAAAHLSFRPSKLNHQFSQTKWKSSETYQFIWQKPHYSMMHHDHIMSMSMSQSIK